MLPHDRRDGLALSVYGQRDYRESEGIARLSAGETRTKKLSRGRMIEARGPVSGDRQRCRPRGRARSKWPPGRCRSRVATRAGTLPLLPDGAISLEPGVVLPLVPVRVDRRGGADLVQALDLFRRHGPGG